MTLRVERPTPRATRANQTIDHRLVSGAAFTRLTLTTLASAMPTRNNNNKVFVHLERIINNKNKSLMQSRLPTVRLKARHAASLDNVWASIHGTTTLHSRSNWDAVQSPLSITYSNKR